MNIDILGVRISIVSNAECKYLHKIELCLFCNKRRTGIKYRYKHTSGGINYSSALGRIIKYKIKDKDE